VAFHVPLKEPARQISLEEYRLWESRFAKLAPEAQFLLQAASYLDSSMPLESLTAGFFKATRSDAYSAAKLAKPKAEILELVAQGWLTQEYSSLCCVPGIMEIPLRHWPTGLELERFWKKVKVIESYLPFEGYSDYRDSAKVVKDFRKAFYAGQIEKTCLLMNTWFEGNHPDGFFPPQVVLGNPFVPEWFQTLSVDQRSICLGFFATGAMRRGWMVPELLSHFSGISVKDLHNFFLGDLARYVEWLVCVGEWSRARELARFAWFEAWESLALKGLFLTVDGDIAGALGIFRAALAELKKLSRKKQTFFPGFAGLFFLLALLKEGSGVSLKEAEDLCTVAITKTSTPFKGSLYLLRWMTQNLQGTGQTLQPVVEMVRHSYPFQAQTILFLALVLHWSGTPNPFSQEYLKVASQSSMIGHLPWVRAELEVALATLGVPFPSVSEGGHQRADASCKPFLTEFLQKKPVWEITLSALRDLIPPTPVAGKPAQPAHVQRVTWSLDYIEGAGYPPRAYPCLQKLGKRGQWLVPKPMTSWPAAGQKGWPEYLSEQDQQAFSFLSASRMARRSDPVEDDFRVLEILIGHPCLFLGGNPDLPVKLEKGEVVLHVTESAKGIRLEMKPTLRGRYSYSFRQKSPETFVLTHFTEKHLKLVQILQSQAVFPSTSRGELIKTVAELSAFITVHSAIGGADEVSAVQTAPAAPRLFLCIAPCGDGLQAALAVFPFGETGPRFLPGKGSREIFAEIEGKRCHVCRDLDREKQDAAVLIQRVPILERLDNVSFEAAFDQIADAFELVLVLPDLPALPAQVTVLWPERATWKKVSPANFASLALRLESEQNWFTLDGSLSVDQDLVVTLKQLLDAMEHSAGRFIKLTEERYLALSQTLERRLHDVRAYSEAHGSSRRLSRWAALSLEEAFEDAAVSVPQVWKDHLQRFREASALDFAVPSTLAASLRPYQLEAFQWLCRMAHWGAGVCLADDMGLGKTIEALALLVFRGKIGPALVVAPTSVCLNWMSEMRRFAPTLRAQVLGPSRREQVVAGLDCFDVLICSYGLLQQDSDLLTSREWATIVLDEGQSIKNMLTQRSRAAMKLRGEFRLLMTGTPIENHLGELWNLFQFLNPGLLGSLERFNQDFGVPIQRLGDKAAQARLKRLLQPFILRRTKSQVLDDLPPRTEITRSVELSSEERALYESLRQKAIEQLEQTREEGGAQHIRILAEITKLRRMCCHPRFALLETEMPSSKHALLEEIIDELLENRHKALVFSQFVDHLQIVVGLLKKKGVAFQYLDGSTPARERKKAVDAFQGGEGELFLISLKAGGLGLNLTAADYVIHLDPWWNPSVEDQASDRAHRIGQTRPVTVYRLITAGTIEEKIVQLHARKRDLADSLLEGTDMADKISADELLALLQGDESRSSS
jgi:superfamily II DNA or RNA helicase